MEEKVIIKYSGHPADMESKLEKALDSIRLQREGVKFKELCLSEAFDAANKSYERVIESMILEISEVIGGSK